MSETTNFEINIPTDNDGFLLLECPLCRGVFKLKPNDFQDDRIFEIYCPCCGLTSDNYHTEDVVELAMQMAQNYANDLIMKELKKMEKNSKSSILKFKVTNKVKKEAELPIMLTVEALEIKKYSCCKREAKIKPILKMCGSYCPYCGVKDYGIE